MRLPRSRKGKTPIDVGIVVQDSGPRIRVSVGEDGHGQQSYRKNSDLDLPEAEALVTYLLYHIKKVKDGDLKNDKTEPAFHTDA